MGNYVLNAYPGTKFTYDGSLTIAACPTCHIAHGFPTELYARAKRYAGKISIYCPNGHPWLYNGKSEEAVERVCADNAVRELGVARQQRDVARGMIVVRDRQLAARKGQITKIKTRSAAGICPVQSCRAHLGGRVRDHIKHEHPDFIVLVPDAE